MSPSLRGCLSRINNGSLLSSPALITPFIHSNFWFKNIFLNKTTHFCYCQATITGTKRVVGALVEPPKPKRAYSRMVREPAKSTTWQRCGLGRLTPPERGCRRKSATILSENGYTAIRLPKFLTSTIGRAFYSYLDSSGCSLPLPWLIHYLRPGVGSHSYGWPAAT